MARAPLKSCLYLASLVVVEGPVRMSKTAKVRRTVDMVLERLHLDRSAPMQ
jgi:hypothetical protein